MRDMLNIETIRFCLPLEEYVCNQTVQLFTGCNKKAPCICCEAVKKNHCITQSLTHHTILYDIINDDAMCTHPPQK